MNGKIFKIQANIAILLFLNATLFVDAASCFADSYSLTACQPVQIVAK